MTNRDPEKCRQKKCYWTKDHARKVARGRPVAVRVFPCEVCRGYHIGHATRKGTT